MHLVIGEFKWQSNLTERASSALFLLSKQAPISPEPLKATEFVLQQLP